MSLTKKSIDLLRYDLGGPSAQILWDNALPGFGIRVFPSQAKSFILDYYADGRKKRLTLGRYGVLTPQQARDRAIAMLGRVAGGADPAADQRERRGIQSLRSFAPIYLANAKTRGNPSRRQRQPKKTWSEDERRINKYLIPELGGRKLTDIKRADVARLHELIGRSAPYEANRVLALLAVMLSVAVDMGFLPDDHQNPARRVTPFGERSRERWVTPNELPALLSAIEAEASPHARGALMLALLTGMRRGEILGLKWQDVDLARSEINLIDTKAGRSHVVPLSSEATDVLRSLPRMVGNPYVFCSPVKPGGRLHDLKRPWENVRARYWLAQNPEEGDRLRRQAQEDVRKYSKHAAKGSSSVEARLLTLAAQKREYPEKTSDSMTFVAPSAPCWHSRGRASLLSGRS